MSPPIAVLAGLAGSAALAVLALVACEDHEQRARAIGAAARLEVAKACAEAAEVDDGGTSGLDACAETPCKQACEGGAVPKGFTAACLAECRQSAVCSSDADCTGGKTCVAIAPRVRRCAPPTAEAPADR